MDGVRRITKKYQTPKKLAESSVDLELKTDCLYTFTSAADGRAVLIVDTSPLVGVVSGKTIWRYQVEPHPWAAEVAAIIWECARRDIVRGAKKPDKSATKKGWVCQIHVQTIPDVKY